MALIQILRNHCILVSIYKIAGARAGLKAKNSPGKLEIAKLGTLGASLSYAVALLKAKSSSG